MSSFTARRQVKRESTLRGSTSKPVSPSRMNPDGPCPLTPIAKQAQSHRFEISNSECLDVRWQHEDVRLREMPVNVMVVAGSGKRHLVAQAQVSRHLLQHCRLIPTAHDLVGPIRDPRIRETPQRLQRDINPLSLVQVGYADQPQWRVPIGVGDVIRRRAKSIVDNPELIGSSNNGSHVVPQRLAHQDDASRARKMLPVKGSLPRPVQYPVGIDAMDGDYRGQIQFLRNSYRRYARDFGVCMNDVRPDLPCQAGQMPRYRPMVEPVR